MSKVIRTLQVQAMVGEVKHLFDFKHLHPLSGELEVTNVGEKAISITVTVRFTGDTGYERLAGAEACTLQPGEWRIVKLGLMPPGRITLMAGTNFDNQCEIVSIPSPGNNC